MAASEAHAHRFVSIADAAAYACVPVGTIRDWVRRGLLPGYRMGPRLLQVNLDDVDSFRRPVRRKPAS